MDQNHPLKFKAFDNDISNIIAPWFDDSITKKYLSDRSFLVNVSHLQSEPVGTEFRGSRKLNYHAFAVHHEERIVGFIDGEIRDKYVQYGGEQNNQPIYHKIENIITASIAFTINPKERLKGYGWQMICGLVTLPHFSDCRLFQAGVKPENIASIKALEKAGFKSDYQPDFENMYYFLFRR